MSTQLAFPAEAAGLLAWRVHIQDIKLARLGAHPNAPPRLALVHACPDALGALCSGFPGTARMHAFMGTGGSPHGVRCVPSCYWLHVRLSCVACSPAWLQITSP